MSGAARSVICVKLPVHPLQLRVLHLSLLSWSSEWRSSVVSASRIQLQEDTECLELLTDMRMCFCACVRQVWSARTGTRGPSTARRSETVANVHELLTRGRRWALNLMEDQLCINQGLIRQILLEDLGKKKVTVSRLSRRSTESQLAEDFIQACENCMVTGDESWMFQNDPERQRQSRGWRTKAPPRSKKYRLQNSRNERRLSFSLINRLWVTQNLNPKYIQRTLNATYGCCSYWSGIREWRGNFYRKELPSLCMKIPLLALQYCSASWIIAACWILAVHLVHLTSRQLAFLFLKMGNALKGILLEDVEVIEKNTIAQWNWVPSEDFDDCFVNFFGKM